MLHSGEMSSNAGGLIRWPAMLMLPLGFSLVMLQGLSEIIKRVGWLHAPLRDGPALREAAAMSDRMEDFAPLMFVGPDRRAC